MVKQEKHVRIKDYAFNELTEFETVKIYESKTRKDYSSFFVIIPSPLLSPTKLFSSK